MTQHGPGRIPAGAVLRALRAGDARSGSGSRPDVNGWSVQVANAKGGYFATLAAFGEIVHRG